MAPQSKHIVVARVAKRAMRSPMAKVNALAKSRRPWLPPGTIRSSNVPDEKWPPLRKHSTEQSRLVAEPQNKAIPKNSSQEAAVGAVASASGEKINAFTNSTTVHTPRVGVAKNPSMDVAVETAYFTAKDYNSCTINGLESAAYWIEQICLAESDGKHWLAAEFFHLALKCKSQPIHRIKGELMDYMARHESAIPFFDPLITAHGLRVNKPKFHTEDITAATSDGFDGKHNAIAGAAGQEGKVTQDMALALVDQLELERLVIDAANSEIH